MKKIFTILLAVFIIMGATAASFAATAADGTYSVSATLNGGTGKATITSATLTVSGGSMKAKVVWSSSNYTWMKVGGVQYNNENSGGNSTFTIPVSALDTPIPVSAETIAMSEPHVIDYTLTFSSSGVAMKESSSAQSGKSDNQGSSSGSSKTSGENKNQADDSNNDEGEEPEEQESAGDSDTITVENAYSKSTSVSADMLSDYEGKKMKLSTVRGAVTFDKAATAYIAQTAKGGITLTMEDLSEDDEYKELGYDLVVDLTLKDEEGNALYAEGEKGKATVTLNYDKDLEEGSAVKVYRINGDSKEEIESSYDAEGKTVTFETEHFSVYAVAPEHQGGGSGALVIVVAVAVVAVAAAAVIFVNKKKRMK